MLRLPDPVASSIDADVARSWFQQRERHVRESGAGADLQHPFSGVRLQRLTDELVERRVPPAIPQVLENGSGQDVDITPHPTISSLPTRTRCVPFRRFLDMGPTHRARKCVSGPRRAIALTYTCTQV